MLTNAPAWTALDTALDALAEGLWPVVISPIDAKVNSPGKAPIGLGWGAERHTRDSLLRMYRVHKTAGVGLKLGPRGGVIDLDVDDPVTAEPVLRRIFPDGLPPTRGWTNANGRFHLLFRWDDHLTTYGKAIIKGVLGDGGEISGNAQYAGLELRLNVEDKQIQTVIPPSLMTNGNARTWNGHTEILPVPDCLWADLDLYAVPEPKPEPVIAQTSRLNGNLPATAHKMSAVERACKYVMTMPDAVEGQRGHDRLFAVACALIDGFGLTREEALPIFREWNKTKALPPESEKQVEHKIDQAIKANPSPSKDLLNAPFEPRGNGHANGPARKAAPPDDPPAANDEGDDEETGINLTDTGNAIRLTRAFGDRIRHCALWGQWLVWDGCRWCPDQIREIDRLARRTVRLIFREAVAASEAGKDDAFKALRKWALASEAKQRLDATVGVARSMKGIALKPEQFDADAYLFNCLNGTVELRTGRLRPHRKDDLLTKVAPVTFDASAKAERWERFEQEVFAGDSDLIQYMRRAVGAALVGAPQSQDMTILYGEGANGKNVYLDTVCRLFGDYGCVAEPNLLLSGRETHPTGLADLCGRRFVTLSETDDGRTLAEALVKRLTGDAMLKARLVRENFFSFPRTFRIFLATNYRPEVKGQDHALWRRIRLVPFSVKFMRGADPARAPFVMPEEIGLDGKLAAEMPGILNLMIAACLEWQRDGLRPPRAVEAATEEYRAEMDVIGAWLAERCNSYLDKSHIDPAPRAKASVLYQKFHEWARENGYEAPSTRTFGTYLERRGFKLKKSGSACWRLWIVPKDADPRPAAPETTDDDVSHSDDAGPAF